MHPGLIGSVVPMLWTFELNPCVSAVKLNAERAADDFHLNAHATIVYIYIYIYIYTIIGRSLVNICKGLDRAAEMPFDECAESAFFAN